MPTPPSTAVDVRPLLQAGRFADAAAALRERTAAQPSDAQSWGLLALAERNLGRAGEAAAAAERAVALAPALLPAWLELAEARLLSGERTAAHHALARADALAPAGPTLVRIARLLHAAADWPRALPRLRQATSLRPDDGALWRALYEAQTATAAPPEDRIDSSRRMAETAGGAVDWMDHAYALFEGDRHADGHAALQRATAADPAFLPAHWAAFQLPRTPAPEDEEAAQAFLHAWDTGVARFTALDPADPAVRRHAVGCIAQCTAFFRHYLDDALDAQRRYGAMLAHLSPALGPRRRTPRERPREGRRRIGVVHPFLREHTVDRLFGPLVAGLDPARFEVHLLAPNGDARIRGARHVQAGQAVLAGPRPPVAWIDLAASLDLDVLLYTEVGMDPVAQLLSTQRLAPVQAMLWGHPVTTGLDTIDVALVSDALEPADAASHYVECVVRLPGLGCALQPPAVRPEAPPGFERRAGALELLCAQTVYKLLPAHDALFARILAALPDARLHLIAHPRAHVRDWLRARMRPTLEGHGVDPARIVLHPFLPHAQYLGLAASCDLGLDSIGWSGGMSALDLFGVGLPIIAAEGPLMRQRQTAALARLLDADVLVATDADDYVARAVALARDPSARGDLRATLQANTPALYNSALTSRFFDDFLARVQPREAG